MISHLLYYEMLRLSLEIFRASTLELFIWSSSLIAVGFLSHSFWTSSDDLDDGVGNRARLEQPCTWDSINRSKGAKQSITLAIHDARTPRIVSWCIWCQEGTIASYVPLYFFVAKPTEVVPPKTSIILALWFEPRHVFSRLGNLELSCASKAIYVISISVQGETLAKSCTTTHREPLNCT